jgi:hypothetical protein
MGKRKGDESQPGGPVSLKTLAAYLNRPHDDLRRPERCAWTFDP